MIWGRQNRPVCCSVPLARRPTGRGHGQVARDRGNAEFGRSASEVRNAAEVGRTENHPVLPGPGVGESVPDGGLPYRTTRLAGAPVRHRAHNCRRVRLRPLSRPAAGHSPGATDVMPSASEAPRRGRSARALRAGCRSEPHGKNWGATRRVEQCEVREAVPEGGKPGGVGPADPSGPFRWRSPRR
jgi:hypothetical protein